MHGTGNDFVLVERRHLPNRINDQKLTKLLCDRNFGVGADGLIIVDLSSNTDADFVWDYYNSDGSSAEMCGNGMRCFAKYVFERGFTDKTSFSVLTKAGIIKPALQADGTVTVNMGKPMVPKSLTESLSVNGKNLKYTYVEVGNPHCVIFDESFFTDAEFYKYGPMIEKHKQFPKGVNVEFVKVLNENEIKCRVWERGAGETLACGTGACAVLVAANVNDLSKARAKISLPGGILNIEWDKKQNDIYLNGSATFVFTGQYNLDPKLVCDG